MNREEFENSSTQKLQEAALKAKRIRKLLRHLEKDILNKQDIINNYQHKFAKLQKQMLEMLALIYSKGSQRWLILPKNQKFSKRIETG